MKAQLKRLKAVLEIVGDAAYDAGRFFRHSQSGRRDLNPAQLRGRMLAKAHSIEKGLSMPDVRPFFGRDALTELSRLMKTFEAQGLDRNDPAYLMGRHAVAAYLEHHRARGLQLPTELDFVHALSAERGSPELGGVHSVTAATLRAAGRGDFDSVVDSRHSIRSFNADPIDAATIERAVALAQKSPSVCNRQGCGVYVVGDPSLRKQALAVQGGNRGFGQEIGTLLVVTSDLSIFRDSKERNQGFVDGGLFAMTLMYAVHYLGLGCCPLNWSASRAKDRRLRHLLGIPDNELVILLLGVGNLKPSFEVASSPRRARGDVIRWIPDRSEYCADTQPA